MNIQYIIVLFIVIGALAVVGNSIWQKVRTSTKTSGCDAGCGCGGKSNKLSS